MIGGLPQNAHRSCQLLANALHQGKAKPYRPPGHRSSQSPSSRAISACAAAGGPYWDAFPVLPGADGIVEVDHYIAGCPPPP